jgi:hypothetical protein
MKFPFIKFPALPQPAFPGKSECIRPFLPIFLINGPKVVRVFAVVDSGADSCVFPASLASHLGIVLPNQNSSVFCGTGNDAQLAFYEDIKVAVWSVVDRKIALTFDLYAGFCSTMEHVGLGLLGQDGFFSKFKVSIDHRNQCFDIEP